MRRKSLLLIYLFCFGFFFQGEAKEVTKIGTTAAPFLTIGVGSRAMSMGGAFTAVANDASALYWNPGGIAQLTKTEIVLNHSDWIAGFDYNFAGISMPIADFGTVGVSISNLDYGVFEQTTENNPEGTGVEFTAQSIALGVTFAKMLTDKFMIGFTGKYVEESIFNSTATGIALDVGVLFVTPFDGLRLGMSISNFGTKMQIQGDDLIVKTDIDQTIIGNNDQLNAYLETGEFDMPLLFRFGLAYDINVGEQNKLTIVTDALHPNDNAESINVGAEYVFNDLVALRSGFKSMFLPSSEKGMTFGAGVNLEDMGLKLDYSYEDFGRLNNVQKYTLHFSF